VTFFLAARLLLKPHVCRHAHGALHTSFAFSSAGDKNNWCNVI
jgi:hypothetical protein